MPAAPRFRPARSRRTRSPGRRWIRRSAIRPNVACWRGRKDPYESNPDGRRRIRVIRCSDRLPRRQSPRIRSRYHDGRVPTRYQGVGDSKSPDRGVTQRTSTSPKALSDRPRALRSKSSSSKKTVVAAPAGNSAELLLCTCERFVRRDTVLVTDHAPTPDQFVVPNHLRPRLVCERN